MRMVTIGLEMIAVIGMLAWAVTALWLPQVFGSSLIYSWFSEHWPYHNASWGLAFLLAGIGGSLWFWVKVHALRIISATALGSGHATILHAMWCCGDINLWTLVYWGPALSSLMVVALTVFDD